MLKLWDFKVFRKVKSRLLKIAHYTSYNNKQAKCYVEASSNSDKTGPGPDKSIRILFLID